MNSFDSRVKQNPGGYLAPDRHRLSNCDYEGILGSVSLAVFLLVQYGYRTFFNERVQLKEDI
jgi:hypothetical protein